MEYKLTPGWKLYLKNKEWSYSSLSTFKQCPYSFYRKYLLKDYRESPNTFFGSAFHDFAEQYAYNLNPDPEEIFKTHKVPNFEKSNFDESVDNGKTFIRIHAHPYRRQMEFRIDNVLIGPYKFVFILDLITFQGNKLYVYDYKSSKDSRFVKEYSKQMSFYYYILKKKFPDKDIVIQLFLPRCNIIYPMTNLSFDEKEVVQDIDTIINYPDFQPKMNRFCSWCPFQEKECPVYNTV